MNYSKAINHMRVDSWRARMVNRHMVSGRAAETIRAFALGTNIVPMGCIRETRALAFAYLRRRLGGTS